MRTVVVLWILLVMAGAAQAEGLRFRIVDARSGAPIAGATVERYASQWQPRILSLPGKFWFPEGSRTTDSGGFATLAKVARDDWYLIHAEGFEEGAAARNWFKFQFTPKGGGTPRDLIEQAGTLVVPLQQLRIPDEG